MDGRSMDMLDKQRVAAGQGRAGQRGRKAVRGKVNEHGGGGEGGGEVAHMPARGNECKCLAAEHGSGQCALAFSVAVHDQKKQQIYTYVCMPTDLLLQCSGRLPASRRLGAGSSHCRLQFVFLSKSPPLEKNQTRHHTTPHPANTLEAVYCRGRDYYY